MQKFEGIHFYVNVANFNEVVISSSMTTSLKFATFLCKCCKF